MNKKLNKLQLASLNRDSLSLSERWEPIILATRAEHGEDEELARGERRLTTDSEKFEELKVALDEVEGC
jgi:hypothetical protein